MDTFEIRSGMLAACHPLPGTGTLTLPEGITEVACELDSAHELASLTVPENSLVRLPSFFLQRSSVQEVHLSRETLFIDAYAFWGCRSLKRVYLTEGTVVHPDAFNGCNDVALVWQKQPALSAEERAVVRSGVLMGYLFQPGETALTVPKGIRRIAWHDVPGSSVLTSVTIPPDTVFRLTENAFRDCTALREVRLSASSVGAGAFRGCTALEVLTVPDGTCIHPDAFEDAVTPFIVTDAAPEECLLIRDGVLYGCFLPEGVTELTVPAGVKRIADDACAGNTMLRTLTLPEGLTEIGDSAFLDCTALAGVTLPESLQRLGRNAFSGCTALQEASIPGGLRIVPISAFEGCTSLQKLHLSEGICRIAAAAFHGCGISSLRLPDSLTEVDKWAFTGCHSLRSVTLSDRTLTDPEAFPPQVSPVPHSGAPQAPIPYAEMFCIRDGVLTDFCPQPDVTDIEIPPEVTVIEDKALFNILTLTGVMLPETVREIRIRNLRILGAESDFNACFWLCSNLTDLIYAPGTVLQQTGGYGFAAPRYVPHLERLRLPELLGSHPCISEYSGNAPEAQGYCLRELILPETDCETFRIDNCPQLEKLFVPASVRNTSISGCPSLRTIVTISDNTAVNGNPDYTAPGQAEIVDLRHTPQAWEMLLGDARQRLDEQIAALAERIRLQREAHRPAPAAPVPMPEPPQPVPEPEKPVPVPEPVPEPAPPPAPEPEPPKKTVSAPAVPLPEITNPTTLEEHLYYFVQTGSESSEAYIAAHFREASRFLLTMDPYVSSVVMSSLRIGTTQNKRFLSSLAQRYGKTGILEVIR
ncbi:MAG: leucine-rich repeat protein [Oscillospiraceae bacterium]|nr:leucine-rich repeat protein [Oscillospiraceae bacterium]